MRLLRREGQSIGEYAILLGLVLGAVFAIQNYVRNRLAGGLEAGTKAYMEQLGTTKVATITGDTQSVSSAETDFTTLEAGTVKTDSRGKSTTINPE